MDVCAPQVRALGGNATGSEPRLARRRATLHPLALSPSRPLALSSGDGHGGSRQCLFPSPPPLGKRARGQEGKSMAGARPTGWALMFYRSRDTIEHERPTRQTMTPTNASGSLALTTPPHLLPSAARPLLPPPGTRGQEGKRARVWQGHVRRVGRSCFTDPGTLSNMSARPVRR